MRHWVVRIREEKNIGSSRLTEVKYHYLILPLTKTGPAARSEAWDKGNAYCPTIGNAVVESVAVSVDMEAA